MICFIALVLFCVLLYFNVLSSVSSTRVWPLNFYLELDLSFFLQFTFFLFLLLLDLYLELDVSLFLQFTFFRPAQKMTPSAFLPSPTDSELLSPNAVWRKTSHPDSSSTDLHKLPLEIDLQMETTDSEVDFAIKVTNRVKDFRPYRHRSFNSRFIGCLETTG